MFCPNCGNRVKDDGNYCRNCGLPIERITRIVVEEAARAGARSAGFSERLFARLAKWSLAAFGVVGLGFIFAVAVYLKFRIFGPEVMAWFGVFGFFLLGALSVIFLWLKNRLALNRRSEADFELEIEERLSYTRPALDASDIAGLGVEDLKTRKLKEPR